MDQASTSSRRTVHGRETGGRTATTSRPGSPAHAGSGGGASLRRPAQRAGDQVVSGDMPKLRPRREASPWARRVLVFATCVLMLDALFGERGLAETLRAREVIVDAESNLARMKHHNAGLREQIRRLKDDPATIEAVAREDLGLIRPGEILVVITDLK